ncbi:hypothetical protein [Oceanibium sediminis]|uniref:hypothetical protein n=1 Tax=Oceanibium sediminis TaxID=2026339 RepID=UPI0013004404|nr:hypothetical protein [Oceanibium sediminis]
MASAKDQGRNSIPCFHSTFLESATVSHGPQRNRHRLPGIKFTPEIIVVGGPVNEKASSVTALLDRRRELTGLIGSWAEDSDFQELCSDALLLLGSIEKAGSRRAKLDLLRLLHKLYAELDEYLVNEKRPGT